METHDKELCVTIYGNSSIYGSITGRYVTIKYGNISIYGSCSIDVLPYMVMVPNMAGFSLLMSPLIPSPLIHNKSSVNLT